ncbi:hypothetical protein SAMN04488498_11719 [Mesorhizobium albiziae]|uniref:Lipoprotein n=1 Tax=Neomesorhizobium albiziae TaxID=335020 RepID=A0A1I4DDT1_9HYPH|nr:hypothetical protein [Mesorhizobium albiziae]GLS32342.1 hypothetical protein GCM10007937_40520 [Mesorhizobium albiziae]SFK91079.1 hypothetical protein SAMN04488498_11719 [Mesorhizobium albiziae]
MRQLFVATLLSASTFLAACQTETPQYHGNCGWRAENAGLCGDKVNPGGFRGD